MSLRNKTIEIQRLISAFEKESNCFHDLTFSVYYLTPTAKLENFKFSSPNHTIMLWQYYGKLMSKGGAEGLFNDLKESDLQWGLRGAEITSFAVIEGETCRLFARMAKRAGSLFNAEESAIIKSRVVSEITKKEASTTDVPTTVLNNNEMAIWLNYLLYYLSMVNPGREKASRIEPDPFSLSLIALEQLLEGQQIDKIDKSLSKIEDIQFKVALSFPSEKRAYVSKIAGCLRRSLGKDKMFYDHDYQSQLAKPNLDIVLQKIYRYNSKLIVVFLCEEYSKKQWCGLEWRAIRDIIKNKDNDKIMFVRFDNADIEGVFSIDGYIDAKQYSEEEITKFILERIALSDSGE